MSEMRIGSLFSGVLSAASISDSNAPATPSPGSARPASGAGASSQPASPREALSALEEVGRPADGEGESAHARRVVRRLVPVETERLQGFPDEWTSIDGPATPDSRRYAAMGDAVTVNVAEWIGMRLARYGS